jgi:serine/threonine protein kinase
MPSDAFSDRAPIGRGSFSQCFKAIETSTGRKVCVEVSLNGESPESRLRRFRQLDVLAGNDHPTVLRLVGFSFSDSSKSTFDIVTELHENGDLEAMLQRERNGSGHCSNATEKSKIIFGIVCGMAYLHSRGILHRNLKPHVVLLNERWEPVIASFALSRHFDGGLGLEKHVGTPSFMAPELTNESIEKYDFSIDVFSFAVTLYGIFRTPHKLDNGRMPKTPASLIQELANGVRYEKPSEIPEYHWSVITRCWKGNPQERPTFVELLSEFHRDHNYVLSGADRSSVLEYEDWVYCDFAPPNYGTQAGRIE